jgi:hypothetical protein
MALETGYGRAYSAIKRDYKAEYARRMVNKRGQEMNEDQNEQTEQTEQTAEQTAEQPKKKRGRQPGQTYASKPQGTKKEKISARQIGGILMLSHGFAASSMGIEQIALDETEAETIAAAVVDVLQFYDFQTNAKTLAWANLVGTLATVYGLKFLQLRSMTNANTNTIN